MIGQQRNRLVEQGLGIAALVGEAPVRKQLAHLGRRLVSVDRPLG
jgi:hypothetical protein